MTNLEKRANILKLTRAVAPQVKRIFRTKQLPNSALGNHIRRTGPSYYPPQPLPPNASPKQISDVYAGTAVVPRRATDASRVGKLLAKPIVKPAGATTLAAASAKSKSGLLKGMLSSKYGAGFFKKTKQTVEGANKRMAAYTDKVYSPKGAASGYLSRSLRETDKARRKLVEQGKSVPKFVDDRISILRGIRETLKGKGPAQRMFNTAVNRHELAERAVARQFGIKAPKFYSHLTPRPMLNDMNVAASMTGQGSEAARKAFRLLRKRELRDLSKVIYPRAGRMKYDPRRLLPGTRAQEQAAARMQNLGLPGNRLNRHEIKKIMSQYQNAANRNTYAFRRASNPVANAEKTNLQFFLQDNPNLIRNSTIGAGGVAGLNKLFRG